MIQKFLVRSPAIVQSLQNQGFGFSSKRGTLTLILNVPLEVNAILDRAQSNGLRSIVLGE